MLTRTITVAAAAGATLRGAVSVRQGRQPAGAFTIGRADQISVCLPAAGRLWLWAPRQTGRIALLDDGVC